jgi:ABC-type transport system substrate-binding protein
MNTLPRSAKIAAQALLSGLLVLAAAIVPAQAAKSSKSYPILVFQGGEQLFVRNFNPFAPWAAQPVLQGLSYEPLYAIDNVQFREYPWLATSYKRVARV